MKAARRSPGADGGNEQVSDEAPATWLIEEQTNRDRLLEPGRFAHTGAPPHRAMPARLTPDFVA
jgi:hypothetical protein